MRRIKTRLFTLLLCGLLVLGAAGCAAKVLNAQEAAAEMFLKDFMEQLQSIEDSMDDVASYYATDEFLYKTIDSYRTAVKAYGGLTKYEPESVTQTGSDEYSTVYMVHGKATFGETELDASSSVTVRKSAENFETGDVEYGVADATPIVFEKEKTLGEKMGNAGLNTLLGMLVVFAMLVLISFIISLFDLIHKAEEKRAMKQVSALTGAETLAHAKGNEPPAPVQTEADSEDTALAAVIAAAIAAYEGSNDPSGIIVRSIRRVSSNNNWKRG
ncbi:MAG: OadG family protein [Lachnospiraceae bacterium]|nr:OadG family protein [Lachnospiraceae bacterium]